MPKESPLKVALKWATYPMVRYLPVTMDRDGAPLFSLCCCLCFLLPLIQVVANPETEDHRCDVTSCDARGPPIKFPFRLESQPESCGFPGFVLSCSPRNDTLMNLTVHHHPSIQLVVKGIDYLRQNITLSDRGGCLPKYANILNVSAMADSLHPFQVYDDSFVEHAIGEEMPMVSLFSCPISDEMKYYDNVPCLNQTVYAIKSFYDVNYRLIGCIKREEFLLPLDFFSRQLLKLQWENPSCKICERRGLRCGFKDGRRRDKTHCFMVMGGTKASFLRPLLGSILGFSLLLVLFAAVRYCSAAKREKANQARVDRFLDDYKALNPSRYSYADLRRITDEFKEKLGQGAYGKVYKGKLSDDIFVAVKMLTTATGDGDQFSNEVGTIGRIRHVNVVRLVGFCADGFRRALVFEFLPNESLEKFIYAGDETRRFLHWEKLGQIALGIARGIEYLHQGCDRRILHFDIKPHNILLDDNFNPKISDFGLAKLCSLDASTVSVTAGRGTMGYIAPEVFSRNFGKVSYKSDVYSFGMLLLEIIEGRRSKENDADEASQAFFPQWAYKLLEHGENIPMVLEKPGDDEVAKKLTIVGLCCIQWQPEDRPSMNLVTQMLEGTEELNLPADPFPTSEHELIGRVGRRPLTPELEAISEDPEIV